MFWFGIILTCGNIAVAFLLLEKQTKLAAEEREQRRAECAEYRNRLAARDTTEFLQLQVELERLRQANAVIVQSPSAWTQYMRQSAPPPAATPGGAAIPPVGIPEPGLEIGNPPDLP